MESIFLSTQGITTTSGGHLANLAESVINNINEKLSNLNFLNIDAKLITAIQSNRIKNGTSQFEFSKDLNTIGKYTSFIAWIREASKAKEALISNFNRVNTLSKYMEDNNLEIVYPVHNALNLSESDKLQRYLNIKELCEYLTLEAKVSQIGKFIHKGGAFYSARKEVVDCLTNPIDMRGNGSESIIYTKESTISADKLSEIDLTLQAEHRELNARLNSLKEQVKQAHLKEQIQENNKFQEKYAEYTNKNSAINAEYNAYCSVEIDKLTKLKIVIPNDLQEIYNELESLSKKK